MWSPSSFWHRVSPLEFASFSTFCTRWIVSRTLRSLPPRGESGDCEGHSVIRAENGGCWYADDVSGDDYVSDAHAEIVRRVNTYPQLVEALAAVVAADDSDAGFHAACKLAREALGKANAADQATASARRC